MAHEPVFHIFFLPTSILNINFYAFIAPVTKWSVWIECMLCIQSLYLIKQNKNVIRTKQSLKSNTYINLRMYSRSTNRHSTFIFVEALLKRNYVAICILMHINNPRVLFVVLMAVLSTEHILCEHNLKLDLHFCHLKSFLVWLKGHKLITMIKWSSQYTIMKLCYLSIMFFFFQWQLKVVFFWSENICGFRNQAFFMKYILLGIFCSEALITTS